VRLDLQQGGGTSLGLATSKALIKSMGGTIGFASTPGHGATFHIDLPATLPQTALATA
jgi:signal transduction histidine kinase